MARGSFRIRLLTVITACLASAVAGALVAAVVDRGERHDHDDHAHVDTTSGLLVTNRTSLRMCVEAGDGPADVAPVRAGLLVGLHQVSTDPNWSAAYGKTRFEPSSALTFGCPAPKLPDRVDRTTVAGPGLTQQPSPYRVWIYVLDDPTADAILGAGRPAELATAELMRETNVSWPVSTALLIRRSQVTDQSRVAWSLRAALGLVSGPADS